MTATFPSYRHTLPEAEPRTATILPMFITPADLATHMGWSERRVREISAKLGACRIVGNRIDLIASGRAAHYGGDPMPLDIYQRGSTWHYRGTVAGRRLRGSCKTTDKTKAARKASQIEERAWKRDTDGPESVLTFAQAAIKYRNAGKSDQFLPAVEDYFKDTLVREITPDVVQEMAMKLWGHATGQSRNRMALKPTQAVINHCAGAKLCQRIRIPRFKEEAKIKTPVDLAWVKAFMAHASPHLGAYALFMYLTGARPSEALAVQWDDLSLNRCTALIRMTKILSEREANLPTLLVDSPLRGRSVAKP